MFILDIVKHSLTITIFVMVIMMILDLLTVQSKGSWNLPLQKNKWLQVIVASLFGSMPGCMGAFVAVSMYTHKMINFAALVALMIATFGDEAFVLFSMAPDVALELIAITFLIAITVGFILNFFMKDTNFMELDHNLLAYHKENQKCKVFNLQTLIHQLLHPKKFRLIIGIAIIAMLTIFFAGQMGHKHAHDAPTAQTEHVEQDTHDHATTELHQHDEHAETAHEAAIEWNWESITFVVALLIGLLMILTVSDHFIHHHLWDHTIKKHFLKIFLWTFGAFLFIHILTNYMDIDLSSNEALIYVLLIAVLVGIIPESGPHIVFITLFIGGTIPFSILLANSIVQDGHGAIPLLAESRKSFVYMKLINVAVGLLVGGLGLMMGW